MPFLALGFASLVCAALLLSADSAKANFGATGPSTCGYQNNNSGPDPVTGCVSLANNKWHAVRFAGLGNSNGWTNIDDDLEYVIDNRLDPTDLVAYRDDTDPLPDVWAMDNNYLNNGFIAWVDCPAAHTGVGGGTGTQRWCRGQYLRFNSFYEGLANGRSLACEEIGHTVGLRHRNHPDNDTYLSCMGVSPTYGEVDYYSYHEITNHINPNY